MWTLNTLQIGFFANVGPLSIFVSRSVCCPQHAKQHLRDSATRPCLCAKGAIAGSILLMWQFGRRRTCPRALSLTITSKCSGQKKRYACKYENPCVAANPGFWCIRAIGGVPKDILTKTYTGFCCTGIHHTVAKR